MIGEPPAVGVTVTLYWLMVWLVPPVLAGGSHVTIALPLPGTAWTLRTGEGTVSISTELADRALLVRSGSVVGPDTDTRKPWAMLNGPLRSAARACAWNTTVAMSWGFNWPTSTPLVAL